MDKLMHEKKIIQQKVEELNYTTLRVSVFNGRNKGREDWQTRIEYDEGEKVYLVYSLGDRAVLQERLEHLEILKKQSNAYLRYWI